MASSGGYKGKNEDIKIPVDLVVALKKRHGVTVMATFNEKGEPHIAHLDFIYPKGDYGFLIMISKDREEYHNMVWQKKIMLNFLYSGNVAYSILCRSGVVCAPSQTHPTMNVMKADLMEVYSDRSLFMNIYQGTELEYTCPEMEEVGEDIMDELKSLAITL
jgi:hypothetical protein